MTIKELRKLTGMTQQAFAAYFEIPKRTVENWEAAAQSAKRNCPEYLLRLMLYKLEKEGLIQGEQKEQ